MSRGVLAQVLKLGLLTSFVILAVSACGGVGGGEQAQQHQTETRAIPETGKPLSAGRYATKTFNPAMSFSVGEGWESALTEMPDQVWIQTGPKGHHQMLFTNPLVVFNPRNPSEEVPAPENAEGWVSWFQSHPNLDTSKPAPVSVGDASGKQIDVTYASTPENYARQRITISENEVDQEIEAIKDQSYQQAQAQGRNVGREEAFQQDLEQNNITEEQLRQQLREELLAQKDVCGGLPCVPLYPISGGDTLVSSVDGWKDRFVIVDVGEEAVLIDVAAPVDEFEAYLPKAQKVLDSVEWKGG